MKEGSREKVVGLIPARFESKRFPGKLLACIEGQSILERVYARLKGCTEIDESAIVLNHDLLVKEVERINATFHVSEQPYICGTDRCIGALKYYEDLDILINVQADQPYISTEIIDRFVKFIRDDRSISIASVMTESICTDNDPNIVKVHIDKSGHAIDFYRASKPIKNLHRHVGLYGFRLSALKLIGNMKPTKRELSLNLEQLRWLDHGMPIKMIPVDYEPISIDVPEDLNSLKFQNENKSGI